MAMQPWQHPAETPQYIRQVPGEAVRDAIVANETDAEPKGRTTQMQAEYPASRFKGRELSLKGYIFDSTGERNPDQFIKTTKEIISYVVRTYTKYTGEFTQAVRDLTLTEPTAPPNPDPADLIAFEMWKLEVRQGLPSQATRVQQFQGGIVQCRISTMHRGTTAQAQVTS